ncbi:HlyD family secretion protein [Coprobacter tertius]|uniref:HlyD family efflux transporter periplasmic adaptor subunit n=1 Tax=Coprobacter tertius TaxID=2944915 RepID=A0ABT1MK35_9BACT|nr:HlyD family efflux transporter periplasmic adaptor subunit [Coprobacter tertius]MCP9612987.1 HlyD family efflux transporter periplasmic adaptor subunit [Coprobacter tertius]
MKKIQTLLSSIVLLTLFCACSNKDNRYDAAGTFEATEVIVSAEANGKLEQFDITEGELLKAGETVGYIDTIQIWLKIQQLKASNKAISSRLADVPVQIAALQQQIMTQKREKYRFENLLKNNAANQKQVDDIDAQITVLEKQLEAQLSSLRNNNSGLNEESAATTLQIAQLEDQLQKCRIYSPITGTVLTKYAEAGELATTGKALFKIADTEQLFLRAYLTSDQLSSIKTRQKVKVIADFGGEEQREYDGTVSWISSKAEFTPKGIQTRDERANLVYAVKIAVKNDGYIKIGMYGEVIFTQQ